MDLRAISCAFWSAKLIAAKRRIASRARRPIKLTVAPHINPLYEFIVRAHLHEFAGINLRLSSRPAAAIHFGTYCFGG
jgi:hypothetical protein